jgi:hypothetical protein
VSLFGNNTISTLVQQYIVRQLETRQFETMLSQRSTVRELRFVVCGCNVPGEGEHKIFHAAEALGDVRRPVVVSVDQDVFVIALLRRLRYDSVQIFRYKQFYNLSEDALIESNYPWDRFSVASFLFGNDFAPNVVTITENNRSAVYDALVRSSPPDDEEEKPPEIMARFLTEMTPHLRFKRVDHVDRSLLVHFWVVYLWMMDYYTCKHFTQKNLENPYYDRFDRNQMITGLCDVEFSSEAYREARETYTRIEPRECANHASAVFIDPEVRDKLERFWSSSSDSTCTIIRMTRRQ